MDQAEPSPLPGQPGEPQRQTPSEEPLGDRRAAGNLDHPVVAGYDGSPSSRNALAMRRVCPGGLPGRCWWFTSPPASTASR